MKDKDFYRELTRYADHCLKDHGIRCRKVSFRADAPYPALPKRYGVFIELFDSRRAFCEWEEPESFVDLLDSVEDWIKKICEESGTKEALAT
jgi:hypothetical protein